MEFLLGFLISFATASLDQSIEIDSSVYFRGEKMGSPRVTVAAGKKAQFMLSEGKNGAQFTLELTPKSKKGQELHFKYNLQLKENKHATISRGQLKLTPGEKGKIELSEGPILVELMVRSQAKLVLGTETL